MKIILSIALVLAIALPLAAQTEEVNPQYLVVPGVSVGPAKLGMTLEEIRAVFGQETRSQTDRKRGVTYLAWSGPGIPGLRVEMYRGKAVSITAYLLKEYRTAENIGVGTLAEDVENTYGMPEFQRHLTAQVGLTSVPIIHAWYQQKGIFFGIRTDTNAVLYVGVTAPKK